MSKMIERDGVALFATVDRADDANAPWIMLSNSLAADHTMWAPQVELLRRRYHVLRYDTRGHGASTAPEGPYGFDDLVGDAVAVLDHHGIEQAVYMGLSLGGMTGLGLALGHPARLARLVCCDARADAPEPFVKGWDERLAVVEARGLAGLLAGTVERWLTALYREAHPQEVKQVEAMILSTSPTGWKGCAEALKRLDYLKDLPKIALPTFFVVGAEDVAAPEPAVREMAAAVPGAELAVVPNAAHLSNVDNAEAFNRAITPFLGL